MKPAETLPATSIQILERLEGIVTPALNAARIPGAGVAVVANGRTVYARGFGYRDLARGKPVTPETIYPIASTTKAINATLLGILADEGRLEWEAPVKRYLPRFRLRDALITERVTVRDLVTMQTGLPRHDWVWIGHPMPRSELVERLAHLEMTSDFRRRFQYSNLSTTLSGHVAEAVMGKSWETLVREKIFVPLGMRRTRFAPGSDKNVSLSYHENKRRRLIRSPRLASELTAPSGGSVHSTLTDMARWLAFNLSGGTANGRRIISAATLARIHTPQVLIGDRPLAGLPADGAYALGWVVHPYNGHKRVWHGGYIHDVNSSIMLFPSQGIGVVSFTNFGCPMFADIINQHVFDLMMGLRPETSFEKRLAHYQEQVESARKHEAAAVRSAHTRPSHPLSQYAGRYQHPGYGELRIELRSRRLVLRRHDLSLVLQHWHYDVWIAAPHDRWSIHQPHPFDRASPIQFHADSRGGIAGVSIKFEPETSPIRFEKSAGVRR